MDIEDLFDVGFRPAGLVLGAFVLIFLFLQIRARSWNPSGLPVFNDRKWFELGYGKATKRYITDPKGLIESGFQKVC